MSGLAGDGVLERGAGIGRRFNLFLNPQPLFCRLINQKFKTFSSIIVVYKPECEADVSCLCKFIAGPLLGN